MSLADQQERDIIQCMRKEIMGKKTQKRSASIMGLTSSPSFRLANIFVRLAKECEEFPELKDVIDAAHADIQKIIDGMEAWSHLEQMAQALESCHAVITTMGGTPPEQHIKALDLYRDYKGDRE